MDETASINGKAMRLYSVSGTVSNLRYSIEKYSPSKLRKFEERATELAPVLLASIGEGGMALASATVHDSDRNCPEPAEGYWIEMEVGGRALKGWFDTLSFENGGHVDAVFDKSGLLMAVNNPQARLVVFRPPCPEGLKPVFNKSMLYVCLGVTLFLFFGQAVLYAFALPAWGEFFELMPFVLIMSALVVALLVLLAYRDELISGRRTRKILKLLGLSGSVSALKAERIGTGYAYRY
ncbi:MULTISPECIES: hypothetical protein [unclassified Burkholderia]|uniref:hypothetical protein n=1 Tax=unclassified Burkholderia TaxID=2613784 RepID=UPI000F576432|nr:MULTISPECIES: hypothetical protein [unclassified Burkholderia]RQS01870.1 hypothetical protein DIE04_01295 [Burkholderia sp. Bp8994]RQS45204.1 hypothetical protein DIE01_02155 [Burkholderia sp. Bp8990]RQZ42853.1 hypothetical protein DIE16_01265 [Burkholderia sp. Bp9090]